MSEAFNPDEFLLGPGRAVGSGIEIDYYSGGPNDKHDWPVLLRASGHADETGRVSIVVERHLILSYTPSGAWVDNWGGKKFVNLRATKQWASTDEAEAIDQLWHRKQSQVRILAARLADAEGVLEAMQKHFDKKPRPARRYWPEEY